MPSRTTISACLLSIMVFSAAWVTVARAQEFRIETDVFVEDAKEPAVQTLTIFHNGVVYDFLLTGVEEITMFDRDRNRLVLMDTRRKVKTELNLDAIVTFMAQMKIQLDDDRRKYLLSDDAETMTDEDGWVKLGNERVTYRAECIKPDDKATALEYQEFADWYARLNAMRPGGFPPFLRIRLNSEIAKRGLLPKTIERSIAEKKALSESTHRVRSQHLANWRLSHTDRKRLDRVGTYLANYPTVTFREYVQPASVATAPRRD